MSIIKLDINAEPYLIYIESGIFKNCGKIIKNIYSGRRIAIITDSNVNRLYGENLLSILNHEGFQAYIAEVEPGEDSKSLHSLEKLCSLLLRGGITRSDIIVTLGGGVVGDLGGFAASVLLRGIKYVQMPTTLTSQVDSSIGGKVGINIEEGKNLLGSFHQPKAVIIDPYILAPLPEKYKADGMGEVIKYACIKDKELYGLLEDKNLCKENFDNIIVRCCKIKAALVQADEKDWGERMLLNFGHTFGHAIEKYYDFKKYSHGEAVALGMLHITAKAEIMGLTQIGTYDRILKLMKSYGLPYEFPQMDKEKVKEIIQLDKKGSSDELKIILLKAIGEGYIRRITKDEIDKWL